VILFSVRAGFWAFSLKGACSASVWDF
jgi:hypothetical protein